MKEQETDINLSYNEYLKLVKRIIQAEAKIIITKELSKKEYSDYSWLKYKNILELKKRVLLAIKTEIVDRINSKFIPIVQFLEDFGIKNNENNVKDTRNILDIEKLNERDLEEIDNILIQEFQQGIKDFQEKKKAELTEEEKGKIKEDKEKYKEYATSVKEKIQAEAKRIVAEAIRESKYRNLFLNDIQCHQRNVYNVNQEGLENDALLAIKDKIFDNLIGEYSRLKSILPLQIMLHDPEKIKHKNKGDGTIDMTYLEAEDLVEIEKILKQEVKNGIENLSGQVLAQQQEKTQDKYIEQEVKNGIEDLSGQALAQQQEEMQVIKKEKKQDEYRESKDSISKMNLNCLNLCAKKM